ncbi:hypothetical protein L798_14690 [Zootermopsis nevadensis]|uniref:Uncharacterized protein n=1 Tax=Zootermopsis nevadensis TaxID=136037 RepID=A0A067QNR8_ZOONE|nr:hypothetical protein L798_14690 [Zootermopsis nevadensis]
MWHAQSKKCRKSQECDTLQEVKVLRQQEPEERPEHLLVCDGSGLVVRSTHRYVAYYYVLLNYYRKCK